MEGINDPVFDMDDEVIATSRTSGDWHKGRISGITATYRYDLEDENGTYLGNFSENELEEYFGD